MTPTPDRPRGLGRGLSALIGDEVAAVKGEPAAKKDTRTLPVAFLQPGRYQPRKTFDEQPLADLAASIKEKGVLSPILVRPVGLDRYEIVAGERRWRAAQLAHLHDVPVLVRELKDQQALEIAIIENVQRADLNALEEAAAYEELIAKFGRTQEDVAREVGKSRSHIANTIRLLKLPEQVKVWLQEGKLTAGHARTLLGVPDPEARARELIEGAMTVRQAEQRSTQHRKPVGKAPKDPNVADLEASISNHLGLGVQIVHKGDKGGEIRISYRSLEQLDEIARRLSKPSLMGFVRGPGDR
jgi:ParB family chromosome partitioning protein